MAERLSDDELFDVAKTELKQMKKGITKHHYPCTYSFIRSDGDVQKHYNQPCYGSVLTAVGGGYGQLEGLIDNTEYVYFCDQEISPYCVEKTYGYEHKYFEPEVIEAYIKWWTTKSFASKAFITKGPKSIIKYGAILDCSYPASYVISAGMGLRYLSEYPGFVRLWYLFKDYINPDAAIFAAQCFEPANGGFVPRKFGGGHAWFCPSSDGYQMFTRAVKHQFLFDKLKPMRTNTNYSPLKSFLDLSDYVEGQKKRIRHPKGLRKEIKNSFGKVCRIEAELFTKEDMGKWLTEFVELNTVELKDA